MLTRPSPTCSSGYVIITSRSHAHHTLEGRKLDRALGIMDGINTRKCEQVNRIRLLDKRRSQRQQGRHATVKPVCVLPPEALKHSSLTPSTSPPLSFLPSNPLLTSILYIPPPHHYLILSSLLSNPPPLLPTIQPSTSPPYYLTLHLHLPTI